MSDKCIMPECPYCPACEYGYIYRSFDWEDDREEWYCLYVEEDEKNETKNSTAQCNQ